MARAEVPPGSLLLLILKTLASGPQHGYGIAQRIATALDPWQWLRCE